MLLMCSLLESSQDRSESEGKGVKRGGILKSLSTFSLVDSLGQADATLLPLFHYRYTSTPSLSFPLSLSLFIHPSVSLVLSTYSFTCFLYSFSHDTNTHLFLLILSLMILILIFLSPQMCGCQDSITGTSDMVRGKNISTPPATFDSSSSPHPHPPFLCPLNFSGGPTQV